MDSCTPRRGQKQTWACAQTHLRVPGPGACGLDTFREALVASVGQLPPHHPGARSSEVSPDSSWTLSPQPVAAAQSPHLQSPLTSQPLPTRQPSGGQPATSSDGPGIHTVTL